MPGHTATNQGLWSVGFCVMLGPSKSPSDAVYVPNRPPGAQMRPKMGSDRARQTSRRSLCLNFGHFLSAGGYSVRESSGARFAAIRNLLENEPPINTTMNGLKSILTYLDD